jgi:hypothetical protein
MVLSERQRRKPYSKNIIRRLFSYADSALVTWFTAGILLSPTETDTVSVSKNVTAMQLLAIF